MGNTCASPQYTRKGNFSLKWQSTAKIIHLNGILEELRQPIKASHVLSQNPNCFLCSSEAMYVDCHVPHVSPDEELQLGQIYFLMPLSKSHSLLSLPELCALAIKASQVLAPAGNSNTTPFLLGNGRPHLCEVPIATNVPERQGCPRIKL